ncbi:MAG: long-chain fatty acid--CoA ligase [Candidatus Hydrogenedentes bacterium]|nr:long-chain fatty acid--CoA ligase [Candidatus Hydrogenedentota bacterium]
MLNLAHFLQENAEKYPSTAAVMLDQYRLTYEQLALYARKVAGALKARGIQQGDRVAMMIPNTPHFPIIYYGILQAGAVVVPVNVLFQHEEIRHYLQDSGAKAFFAFKMFEEQARKAVEAAPECAHFIVVSTPDDLNAPEKGENFNLFLAGGEEADIAITSPEDTAVILYTSGTTGAPKGAELSHFNMFFNAYFSARDIVQSRPGDVVLVTLPLFHSFGQTCLMNAGLVSGATLTMLPRFETEKAMRIIDRDRVTIVAMVPTMYFFILNFPEWQKYDFSSIRMAVSGGAALPEEVHRRFKERYGITILEGYGLSETSPVASFTLPGEEVRVGSIGKPIWGVQMRIRRDDGSFAPPGEVGEIVIRGHNVMKGYHNNSRATAAAIVDGWFLTGDIGKMDEDGYFYILDRKKDIIIRGGMNIYPREIEEVLYRHPKVREASVVGVPDEARGEEVKAYVSPAAGETLTPEEVMEYLKEHIARYKWPKEVVVLEDLPKGPTGKILKRELKMRH